MPVILHDNTSFAVERAIDLPDWYHPHSGDWIYLDETKGLMQVDPVIYDGTRGTLFLCCAFPAHDPTLLLAEWLDQYPEWEEADTAFLLAKKRPFNADYEDDEDDDEDQD